MNVGGFYSNLKHIQNQNVVYIDGVYFILKYLIRIYCDNTPSKALSHRRETKNPLHMRFTCREEV